MSKYSETAQHQDAKHTVSTERVFKRPRSDEVDDEEGEEIFAPEDMGKAYKVRL